MLQLNFNPFPILSTKRLVLRGLSIDDATDIYTIRSNELVNKYLYRIPLNGISDAIDFIVKI